MKTLEDAIALAVEKHRGVKDKAGQPYVLHPLRVMFRLESEHARMAAVLHDVVEDTDVTVEWLREQGYPEPVCHAIERLTKRKEETYEQFIDRAAEDPLARQVKLADLEDNMDVRRLGAVGQKEQERLDKYLRAWRKLKALGA